MIRCALIFLFISGFVFAQPTNWDEWIKSEGYYLLTGEQKEEFRKLNDTQKELFVRSLWESLDPNPITPENEFQADYQTRYAYAKKHYGIPSDRAKIYILLGKPNSVESHPSSDKYYPLELWSYYSLGLRGLPPSLELIFFKRWGAGEYRLYSPLFDGFKALTPSQYDPDSSPRARMQLKAIFDPQIIQAAERYTVGSNVNESETIRMVLQDPGAIKRLLIQKQRPSVETTVVYQGFEADVYTYAVPHGDGTFRTSIALSVPPKYMTFEKDQETYQARIDLLGKITDEKGNEILKINDSPYLKLSGSEFERAKSYHFAYQFDSFLLPGKYHLECLYRDYASNAAGKIEKSFDINPLTGELQLLPPLFAFKISAATSEQAPFVYSMKQFFPKENFAFNAGQSLVLYSVLANPQKIKLEGIWQLKITLLKGNESVMEVVEDVPLASSSPSVELIRTLKLQGVIPGSYSLKLEMSRDTTKLQSQAPLKISTEVEVLGRMRIVAPFSAAPENYHSNLALQYYNHGQLVEASKHVRIALDFAPSSYAVRSLSARIEKAKGNNEAAIASYEKLLQENAADVEGTYLLGKWLFEKQDWQRASEMMKKALDSGYYTTEILNSLGRIQIHMGNTVEAIGYWEKSLVLNSNQPEIQKELETHRQ
ncbi:GWxTD domain-containing protein [bacterium]|nr:GWxTD domain-containing protein [bacterium]